MDWNEPPQNILYISKIISKRKEMVIRNRGAPGRGIYKIIWAPLGALPLNRRRWGRRGEWSNLGQKRDSKSNVPFWSLHFLSAPSFPRNPQHSTQTPTEKKKTKNFCPWKGLLSCLASQALARLFGRKLSFLG